MFGFGPAKTGEETRRRRWDLGGIGDEERRWRGSEEEEGKKREKRVANTLLFILSRSR